jgi:hypothetical protein
MEVSAKTIADTPLPQRGDGHLETTVSVFCLEQVG